MLRRRSLARSGITLTEILIAIMILGIGMVSVATLFPIGIMRLREATQDSRSTILAMSAKDDADVRGLPRSLGNAKGLVNPESFVYPHVSWYQPWVNLNLNASIPYPFKITPLTHDLTVSPTGAVDFAPNRAGVSSDTFSPGLPVAYDPLFWATTHYATEGLAQEQTPAALRGNLGSEGRFGSALALTQAGVAAHGLQRITNFAPYAQGNFWSYTYLTPTVESALATNAPWLLGPAEVVGDVFTSLDDPVTSNDETGLSGSPVVPADFGDPNVAGDYTSLRDYNFSWMLTGRLGVAGDPTNFEGDLVVFQKRAIGFDTDPVSGALVPLDERVVEAIWGHTTTGAGVELIPAPRFGQLDGTGYARDDRTVLLRWPAASNDPRVRVGDYIADVTYERFANVSSVNYPPNRPDLGLNGARYSGQRVHWYRIVSRSDREFEPALGTFRYIIRVESPLKAKTRLRVVGNDAEPAVREAALICPSVVKVAPVMLYSR